MTGIAKVGVVSKGDIVTDSSQRQGYTMLHRIKDIRGDTAICIWEFELVNGRMRAVFRQGECYRKLANLERWQG